MTYAINSQALKTYLFLKMYLKNRHKSISAHAYRRDIIKQTTVDHVGYVNKLTNNTYRNSCN